MRIKALAPWFGSKRTLAPRIVEELGPHRTYWEPFCGSCSVLFVKERASYETVNDLHRDLYNLALVVQDRRKAEDLYERVSRTLFHEDMLPLARQILTGELDCDIQPDPDGDVHRAYWYLVFSWMGLNGTSGTPLNRMGTFAARYSGKGGNGAMRWSSVAESITDWHQRLLGVQFLNRDAFELIDRIEDEDGMVMYVDPPYLVKGTKYIHDFKPADHERLAMLLRRFRRGRVVVSYYAHPVLSELYQGWTTVVCDVAKSMVNGGMRDRGGRVAAPEVLLINGSSRTAQPELFA